MPVHCRRLLTVVVGLILAFALVLSCDKESGSSRRGPIGPTGKQILFGDLHAHTTFSLDAFVLSLHALGGRGQSPPSQACNFARYCSQLDFWSINDHAELLSPRAWLETKEAIRACNNQTGGNSGDPDMVTFLGWEWTQTGITPEDNFGHKNVIFLDTDEDKVPRRPIAALGGALARAADLARRGGKAIADLVAAIDPEYADQYKALGDMVTEMGATPLCPEGVDTRDLPSTCQESTSDPAALFEKMAQWGFESLVIPHGTAWGLGHPPLSYWSNQMNLLRHDPDRQRLIEVYSGHGNSEEFRSWKPFISSGGKNTCPEPTANYLPCCWRLGEILRERSPECQADPKGDACNQLVEEAQKTFMGGGISAATKLPDITPEDWLDCGQCRDCFQPAFKYAVGASVQAALADSNLDDPSEPVRYRFGLIGSTDAHRANPGSGFREQRAFTENFGPAAEEFAGVIGPLLTSVFPEWERLSSFWYTGALVAIHAADRSREAVWDALKRREVYGTSGDRILLWFDLVNPPAGTALPMGSEVRMSANPEFEVTAVGSFKQAPGCARDTIEDAPPGFIQEKCLGECYNPTDERYLITRIEVVRIRPKIRTDEDLARLIDDPWKTLTCPPNPEGCKVRFDDPDFSSAGRPMTYYVRAILEPTPQFNADQLRCAWSGDKKCTSIRPCYGGYRAGAGDDCLGMDEERAWSSPIFVDPAQAP